MTAETLLQEFEVMTDAPNGVQKLRELILQLAVRGKLVHQDPSDEPASLLLKQIAEKVERNYANGGIGKPTPAGLLAADDIPHHVPDSWRWVRLSLVGAIVGGGTPKTEVAAYWVDDGGVPWLTPADLNGLGSKYAHRGRRQISQLGLENSAAQILPTGSVLFSSRAPIGYVAIAANPLATNQGFKSCVPYVELMSEFIFRFLQAVGPEVDRNAPGTTFREVSGKIVGQIPFPLPPLAEQRRITAKLDELMALCDTLEAQQQRRTVARMRLNRSALHQLTVATSEAEFDVHWQRVRENFHLLYDTPETVAELRQAVLQLAVRGKLVPLDPSEEPVSADAKNRGPDIPANWSLLQLGDVTEINRGITFPGSAKSGSSENGSVACLRTANVQNEIDWGDLIFVPEEYVKREDQWVRRDDVIISMANSLELVGKVALVRDVPQKTSFGGFLSAIRAGQEIEPEFLFLLLRSPDMLRIVRSTASRTTNIANVSLKGLRPIELSLPPLAEQRRIVAKVEELMALCDALEAQLTRIREKSAHLAASAVHHLSAA